jgi:ribosomal-protein-alanine N-acetyltransferase
LRVVTLRSMTADDLERVAALERSIFPEPWSRGCFETDGKRADILRLVAEEQGVIVAYLVAWGMDQLHIANVATATQSRRQGIGSRLMARAERFARERGLLSLYLEVRESNTGARAFYRRLGFVQTHSRRGYYSNGEDAVIMERDVAPAGDEARTS